jgi:hypothetical protein
MTTNTILQQGGFVATGGSITIPLRSGVDWMRVYNLTEMGESQITPVGVEYYWQSGLQDIGIVYYKSNYANASNLIAATDGLFQVVDSSLQVNGIVNATITAISNAAIPVVTNSGTNGLVPGNVVRLFNVDGGQQLGGMDFTVGYNTLSSTTFSLDYMEQMFPATTGSWMTINFSPLYYPRRRFITHITQASQAVITLSVTHQYEVGQEVRLHVPAVFGMKEMDGLQGTILAINTTVTSGNTITVDIDSSAFTAFAFPDSSDNAFTPATVVPLGENTASALGANVDILSDATVNRGFIGMILSGGESKPGGAEGDIMAWQAGTAFSNDNGIII